MNYKTLELKENPKESLNIYVKTWKHGMILRERVIYEYVVHIILERKRKEIHTLV